jgi:hypothetical protein
MNEVPEKACISSEAELAAQQVALGIKLSRIFAPPATRQREAVYEGEEQFESAVQKNARFIHYTTAEAALGIINSKRLWMRNASCMSDYSEIRHGYSLIYKFFADESKKKEFITTVDTVTQGAAVEALKRFDQWWTSIQLDTYIASLSEHDSKENDHGRLSMWRAFGRHVAQVGIVFRIPWQVAGAESLKLFFSPVAYSTASEADAVISEVIGNVRSSCDFLRSVDHERIINCIFEMLLIFVTCFKHEGFREEREWRAIYLPTFNPSPLIESGTEIVHSVPQRVHKIPLDASVYPQLAELDFSRVFDRLIIGPSPHPWPIYEAFVDALTKAGVSDAHSRVCASLIPIRS